MSDTVLSQVKKLPVVHALALIAGGSTREKACKTAGISVSTFQRVLDDEPEVALGFIQEERAKIISLYSDITDARAKLVKALIANVELEDLTIKDELALELRLRELQTNLETELSLLPKQQVPGQSESNKSAEEFLATITGPRLKQGVGVTLTKVTETIAFEPIGDVVEAEVS
jgi:hypothetical protein